jgi:hypothetical protein
MKVDEPVEQLLRRAVRSAPPPAVPSWEQVETAAAHRRRPRRRVRVALAAAVLALAALLAVGGLGRNGRPSTIARAKAGLLHPWPAEHILHVTTRTVFHFDQPDVVDESWQLTSAPFTRRGVTTIEDGDPADRLEMTVSGDGRGQLYDWRTGQVVASSAIPVDYRPTSIGETSRDQMGRWLTQTGARELGPSEVDGHHVLGFEAFGHDRFYLDADTFLPVLWQVYGMGTGDQSKGYDVHYQWQLLDDTKDSRQLLDVAAQHPGAGSVDASGDAWRQRAMALGPRRAITLPGG